MINKHFPQICLLLGGMDILNNLGEEKFWLGIRIYRFCLTGNWSWVTLWDQLNLTINNKVIEQKLLFAYFDALLDPMLSFTKHIENYASKATKAMSKIVDCSKADVGYLWHLDFNYILLLFGYTWNMLLLFGQALVWINGIFSRKFNISA